jgi:hypothetical protein
MFTLHEVIIITGIISTIFGYIAFKLAEYLLFVRMLASLSEDELDRLDKLRAKLEAAIDDADADRIIADARQENSVMLTQEVVDGNTYLYDTNNTFVAQGSSAAEAALSFFNRHSHSRATVRCGEGKEYHIIDGRIERLP